MFEKSMIAFVAVLGTTTLTCDKPDPQLKRIASAVPVAIAAPVVPAQPQPMPMPTMQPMQPQTQPQPLSDATIRFARGAVDVPSEMRVGDRADSVARALAPMLEGEGAKPNVSDAHATLTRIENASDGPVGVFVFDAKTNATKWTGTARLRANDATALSIEAHGTVDGGGTRDFKRTYSSSSYSSSYTH